jgi:hypothetical protein
MSEMGDQCLGLWSPYVRLEAPPLPPPAKPRNPAGPPSRRERLLLLHARHSVECGHRGGANPASEGPAGPSKGHPKQKLVKKGVGIFGQKRRISQAVRSRVCGEPAP